MLGRWRSRVLPYVLSGVAVIAVTAVTGAVPILHDRFTFFLFWPLLLAIGWFAGIGPALLATALSTTAVVLQLGPAGTFAVRKTDALVATCGFSAVAASTALLVGWRRAADARLHESRQRFAMVANSAPVLIWMSDREGGCTYVNEPWARFTGRDEEDALGDGWLRSVHPDDRKQRRRAYREASRTLRPFEIEYRLRRFDGEYRVVLDHADPQATANVGFIGYVGSCVDVTDHRAALRRAEVAREQAEEANRAKDVFLGVISDELRAPLSPIIAWTQMLQTETLSADQRRKALHVIERNARTEAQLVENLLDVSRIVEGQLRLAVRPVSLAEVVEHAVATIRPAADAKSIAIHLVVDTTIPPISGDPERLQQVVWNLVSNAVKFTPKRGQVHVVLARVESHVEIAVSDTGAGIEASQIPHVFERFWQADVGTGRHSAGLGLGLPIVRHLVELHGGTVVVESPGEGLGSTFTVKLPIAAVTVPVSERPRRPLARQIDSRASPARLDGVRVLLVDDQPDSNEAVRMLLDGCGAEVRVAGSARLALEVLDRWRPDVLVTDIGMPGGDGYALVAKVRQHRDLAGLPAIALTASSGSDDRARMLAAGFQLHVAKPAEPAELTAAVAAVAARTVKHS
jgi:PAS domain S-box-containing protein